MKIVNLLKATCLVFFLLVGYPLLYSGSGQNQALALVEEKQISDEDVLYALEAEGYVVLELYNDKPNSWHAVVSEDGLKKNVSVSWDPNFGVLTIQDVGA